MNTSTLAFCTWIYKIEISPWCNFPLMSMKYPFSSLSINLGQISIFISYLNGYSNLLFVSLSLGNLFQSLFSKTMSIFDDDGCMFLVYSRMMDPGYESTSASLCLLIRELSPLMLRNIKDQWLLIPVYSLCWSFPSGIICRAGLEERYCLILGCVVEYLVSSIYGYLKFCWVLQSGLTSVVSQGLKIAPRLLCLL